MAELAAAAFAPSLDALTEETNPEDQLKVEHSFNIMFVGESGQGKSTLVRDMFNHLDPSKIQESNRLIAAQTQLRDETRDKRARNLQEAKLCDDKRSLELITERKKLDEQLKEIEAKLMELKRNHSAQRKAVSAITDELKQVTARQDSLRAMRDRAGEEGKDEDATRCAEEVIELEKEREALEAKLKAEKRTTIDKDEKETQQGLMTQTLKVERRVIRGMPLYPGAKEGIDLGLIDIPGWGDVNVGTAKSYEFLEEEVSGRIWRHNNKKRATIEGMPLDDEKRLRNELIHLCLFFIPAHRLKATDLELMRRLHERVPLVVVIAKSDTMTIPESKKYKEEVSTELQKQGITTFTFDSKSIKDVESLHRAQPSPKSSSRDQAMEFKPLYGGSDPSRPLPWSVMGADEQMRVYPWGTVETNHPHHSELPALRDLILRFGGWKQLKTQASLMADREGEALKTKSRFSLGGLRESFLKSESVGNIKLMMFGAFLHAALVMSCGSS